MSVASETKPSSRGPKLPWKTSLFLSTFSLVVDTSLRSNGTINRFLINLFDLKASPSPKPLNGVKTFDFPVDPSRNLWFRLYVPTTEEEAPTTTTTCPPVIFYFHGGGFVMLAANSKQPYDDYCRRLARELPAVLVSVNYRLAPEHRYPSQYEDAFDVLKFVDERGGFDGVEVNADFSRCFLAGDSAGGNLAHHVAVKLGGESGTLKELKVIGLMAIQPFFGGEERTESEMRLAGTPLVNVKRTDWMWKAFLPEGSDRDHPAVNVSGPKAADISGVNFPATVVFVGGFDPLKDWQKRYYEWLKKSGKDVYLIEYSNAIHSFYAFPEIHESGLFVEEVRAFLQNQSIGETS